MCIERLLSAVFYVMLCKPARPALQPHYSDRNIEAGKSEITQGLGSPQPGETPAITTTWARSDCKRGPFPVQPLHPQQNLGKAQSGTLRASGGDSRPPPRKSGPPRALEIPRAPRTAARLPGNQEKKTSAFFFLFWHSRSPTRPPRALLPVLAPTWGAPTRRSAPSPPSANRRAVCTLRCPSTNRRGE